MRIAEFLRARIDEEAACAREALAEAAGFTDNPDLEVEWVWAVRARPVRGRGHATTFVPQPYPRGAAHVLAECEAKRRIVEVWERGWQMFDDVGIRSRQRERDHVLRLLALPYADHPDYDDAWRT